MKVNFYATFRPLVGSKDVDIPLRDGATLHSELPYGVAHPVELALYRADS